MALSGLYYREDEDAYKKGKCWISINQPGKTNWDLFIMILATYNCFQIPIEVAFSPESFKSFPVKFTNSMIDFLFLIDIIVSFRTSYIEEGGQEISSTLEMAKMYAKGQLTIDVFATIPFDTLAGLMFPNENEVAGAENNNNSTQMFFKLLGVLKLVRILRLNKIITYLRSSEETKSLLKLMKLIFLLVLYLHIFGCAWWLTV
jgi:hypothetical protein